jgi:hypothetical protein
MIRFNSRPLSGPEEPKSHGRAVPLSDQGFFPLVRTHIIFVASPEQMSKEELRQRIERDPQLKKDFDFLIAKTGLMPEQFLTGLRLDCNLMKANRQMLLSNEKKEMWPISRDTLKRNIKNIRRAARQIETTNQTEFSPA